MKIWEHPLVNSETPTGQVRRRLERLSCVEGSAALPVLAPQLPPVGQPPAQLLVQARHPPVSHEHGEQEETLKDLSFKAKV